MDPIGMDDVEEVGTVSEEDLRAAAMAKAFEHRRTDPVLALNEFTNADWIQFVKEQDGRVLDKSTARRELDEMVEDGILKSGFRYDPRTKRQARGFWYVETAEEEKGVPP